MDEWTDGPDQLAGHEETRMQEFLIIPITVILFVKYSCFRLFVYFFLIWTRTNAITNHIFLEAAFMIGEIFILF